MKLAYRPVFPAGLVGSAPPMPDVNCPGADCTLDVLCQYGTAYGYQAGYQQLPMDPQLADSYSDQQRSTYAACYQDGYDQGVRERETGTRVCDVINIQTALNRLGAGLDVDGDWGPKTEAALKASGKSCTDLVPACKTCPRPAATPVPATPPKTTPASDTDTTTKSSIWPWVVGGAVVAAVGLLAVSAWPWPNPTPAKRLPGGGWNRDFMVGDHVVVGGRVEKGRGASLLGKQLRIVSMDAHYVETDDGSRWTHLRNGGYNYRLGRTDHYEPALHLTFSG
jgi:hypothetical protein